MNYLQYTLAPVADINQSHSGFLILSLAAAIPSILAYMFYLDMCGNKKWLFVRPSMVPVVVWVILMIYPFYDSYIKEYPVPKNEPIVAILVDGYTSDVQEGKVAVSAEFVTYKVPEGQVSFRRLIGMVYSSELILYRQF